MMKTRKKNIIVSVFAVAVLIFSTLTAAAMGIGIDTERETTTILVEVEDEDDLRYLEKNADILVDYDNGRYLVEVPEERAEDVRSIYDDGMDDSRYEIYLDTIRESFDRREGTPELPEEYREETGAYIVQFIGPVQSMEWREQVSDAGASVEREMANYALLVRMDEDTKSEVEELDIVDWIDPYYSGYKVSEELLNSEEEEEKVRVTGWTQEDDEAIVEKLERMDVDLERETSTGPVVNLDTSLLSTIGGFEEVRRIDPYSYPELHDNVANEIHEVQSAWYPSWSGLPEKLTGEGEVVGVQDTGFDEGELLGDPEDGNPDFYQPDNRIIRYTDREGGSDPDGINIGVAHGSHVAGIIGGDGSNWRNHLDEDPEKWHLGEATGVAPEVHFSLDGTVDGDGNFYPTHGYWDDQEADGARVFQNSWGAGPSDYDGDAEDIDERQDPYSGDEMAGAPENIIVFSAGNDGPEEHTIGSRAIAKNALGVGASQNYRSGEYMNADNPDYVADFSSRGGPDFSYGRIKPDVVAAGTAMISPMARGEYEFHEGDNPGSWIQEVKEYAPDGNEDVPDYQYMQGTSMSGPQAAGMASLIREYYRKMHDIENPTNPLVKATMINGAERMDSDLYEYPGYAQGWGRPNLRNSLYPSAPQSNQFAQGTFEETGTWDAADDGGMNIQIDSSDEPFKTTLNWLDSAGMEMNRELHMYAESPSGDIYYSGVDNYDDNGWTTPGSTEVDTVNTVQRIEVQDPEPGSWNLTVQADSIPSNADFAVVTSADFGPQEDHDVDLNTDYHTIQSLATGGTTHLPVEVTNWGNNADTIELTDTSPAELTVSYSPESTVSLDSTEMANIDVMITADDGLNEQVIEFEITATSQDDPSDPPAADSIGMTIQILTEPLPSREKIADSEADEMFPEIITFSDQEGTDWMFAAYQMVTPEGQQVRVKYSELGEDGAPIEWHGPFNPMSANPTEDPDYVELQHIDSGTYEDRVIVHWNGNDPDDDDEDAPVPETEAKASWADHGSYDTWEGPSLIDHNHGSGEKNLKRASYMLFRDDGTEEGELTYVFEHLDYDEIPQPGPDPWGVVDIGISYVTSGDGGETWSEAEEMPGTDDDTLFFFFPNGVTDQNDVNWHFFYYRGSDDNQRIVVTILQDDEGWSDEIEVVGSLEGDPVDNHQFPMAAHHNNEGTNEIYMSCLYDNAGEFFDLTTSYVTGDYSSTDPPAEGDFTSYDNVAGDDIVDEDMSAADILGKAAGEDGWVWTAYLESETPFDVPNVNVARSDDQYGSVTIDYVTRDNYRKLNPNMASHTIDGTSYAYVAYHSSHGTTRDVNHEIFLSILHSEWEEEPDTEGPETSHVSSNPNPVNLSADDHFELTASIDDMMTGGSGIQAAEYVETDTTVTDPTTIDWTEASEMVISGLSSTEIATEGMTVPDHWEEGETYRYWVRGQDTEDNWGTEKAAYVDIRVTGEITAVQPPTDPEPEDGATDVATDVDLSVYVEHDDDEDMDVYFQNASDDSLIGTDEDVPSGTRAEVTWEELDYDTTYEWYTVAYDGVDFVTSDTWTFTTEEITGPEITITRPEGGEGWNAEEEENITWETTEGTGDITEVDLEYTPDDGGTWNEIATGIEDTGNHTWPVPDDPTDQARVRGTVHDDNDLSHQNESDLFTILGTPPEPPEYLEVEHTGTEESQELVTNGTFPDDYEPWELTRIQDDGEAEHSAENFEEGGSIHVNVFGDQGGILNEEAYWEQEIGPTDEEITINGAFRKISEGAGNGGVRSHYAAIAVYDTGAGWEYIYEDADIYDEEDSGWIEFGPDSTYQPDGEVNEVRAHLHAEIDEGNQWYNADIWMDNISIMTEGDGEGNEDNLVTWGASPDDPDDVVEYDIYRAEEEDGDYQNIATVDADGSAEYEYVDEEKGAADDIFWWYVVHAVDEQDQECEGTEQVREPGPLPPTDPQPEDGATVVDTDPELSVYVNHTEGEMMDIHFYEVVDNLAQEGELIDTDQDVESEERASVIWDGLEEGTTYEWFVEAEDHAGNVTSEETWEFTTEGFGVNVTAPENATETEYGTYTYDFTVENNGTSDDTYDLDVTSTHEDFPASAPDQVSVPAGTSEIVGVEVEIDETVESGESTMITLTATSQNETTVTDSDRMEVFYSEYDVQVSAPDDVDETEYGVHTYYFSVENNGTLDDTYDLEVTSTHADFPASAPDNISVAGETSEVVEVEVEIDETVGSGESSTITLTADSQNATATDSDSMEVTYLEIHELTVEDPENGTILVDGTEVTEAEESFEYENGSEVPIEAVPSDGYYFVEWLNDTENIEDPESNQTVITIEENYTITASFEEEIEVGFIEIDPEETTITAGESLSYNATAYDEEGDEIGDVTEETTWSIDEDAEGAWDQQTGTYTSENAGNWTVEGEFQGHTDDALLHVEVGEVDEVVIDPEADQTVAAGEELLFDAWAYDEQGNLIEDDVAAFIWENATNGVFEEIDTGEYNVTATYEGVTSSITNVTVEAGDPDSIIVEPQEKTITAGETTAYNATAYDEFNNEIEDVTGDTDWSIEDGAGGGWSDNNIYESENAGEWNVTGTYTYDGDDLVDEAILEVEAGEVDEVIIWPEGEETVEAGEELIFEAEAYDEQGNLIEDDVGEFTWENATNGLFYEEEAGEYNVTATYEGVTSPVTTVTVEAGDADSLEIVGYPENITAGESFQVTVQATDGYGNPAVWQELEDFVISSEYDGEVYSQGTITLDENGNYTADVNEDQVTTANETHQFTADAEGVTDDSVSIMVKSAQVDHVVIIPEEDQTVAVGEELEFDAWANDTYDNVITDAVDDFDWENATNGLFYEEEAGEYNVTATYDGVTSPVTIVTVEPTDVDYVVIEPEDDRTITAGDTIDFTAEAYDEDDDLIDDEDTNFTWVNTDDTGLFQETETGVYEVTATLDGVTSPITNVTVEPADVDYVVIDPEEDQTVATGEELAFTSYAYDEHDNLITDNVTEFTWENISEFDEEENMAVFYQEETGEYNVTATYDGVTSPVTIVTVEPTDVDYVVIYPEEDQVIEAGDTIDFTAEAYDQYDNLIDDEDDNFTWQNTDGTGFFDQTTAGMYEVNATYDEVTSPITTVTVEPADVDYVVIDPEEDQTVATGEELAFTSYAYDEHDNLITDNVTEFTWENISEFDEEENIAVFYQEEAGEYNVTATYEEVTSPVTIVTVEPTDVHYVVIYPEEDQVIEAGDTIDFTAEAYDEDDNLIDDEDTNFTWVNTDDTGLFQETETGEYEVTATLDGVTSPITNVTVEPADVDYVVIDPEEDQTVATGEELAFTSYAYDEHDNLITDNVTEFTWENISEFDEEENIAVFYQEEAGEYNVTATYEEVTSPVTIVTVEPTDVHYVVIYPEEDQTITAGDTIDFTAEAYDENDNLIDDEDTNFTWINTDDTGFFDETDTGEYEVTATLDGVTSPVTNVTVEAAEVDYVVIDPEEDQTVATGEELAFTSYAYDEHDNLISDNVTEFTWENISEFDEEENVAVFYQEETGEYDVTATYEDVTSPVTIVTVEPTDVHYVVIYPEDDQVIEAGETIDFTAEAYDEDDNLIDDEDTNFTWINTDETGLFQETETGVYEVTATLDGVTSPVTNVTVEAAEVDYVVIDPEEDQVIEAGDTIDFSAEAYDQYDNLIDDEDGNFVWQDTDETGFFEETSAGVYEVTATYDEVTSPITTVTVESAEVDYVVIDPEEDRTITAGDTIDFSAEAYDQYDNLIDDEDGNFVWQDTDETGFFEETSAGVYEVTATYDEVTSPITTVTVESAEVDYVVIDPEEDQTVTIGEELPFTSYAYDEYDNLISDDVTEFTWENISEFDEVENVAVFYEEEAGEYDVTATYNGETSPITMVTVEPTEVEYVVIEPEEDQVIDAGDAIDFTAEAYDEDDNLIDDEDTNFTWTSTDETGLFQETETGVYEVTAALHGVTSPITNVTVEPAEVDYVVIEPEEDQTVAIGEELPFTSYAYDEHDNLITEDVTEFTWENISEFDEEENVAVFYEEEAGEYNVTATYNEVDSPTTTVIVEPVDSYFEVEIVDHDEDVSEDEEVLVEYSVKNLGDVVDTQTITFAVYDEVGQEIFSDDEEVTLSPMKLASEGVYEGEFVWSNEENLTGEFDLILSSDDDEDNVTVTISAIEYDLTINTEEGGTTDPEPGTYSHERGTEITIEAIPEIGWQFSHWEGDHPEGGGEEDEIEIVMDSDKEITAVFEEEDPPIDEYALTIEIDGSGVVIVEWDGEEEEVEDEKTFNIEEDTQVTLTVEADEDWEFVEWTGTDETGDAITITMDEDKEITATFEEDEEDEIVAWFTGWFIWILILIIAIMLILFLVFYKREAPEVSVISPEDQTEVEREMSYRYDFTVRNHGEDEITYKLKADTSNQDWNIESPEEVSVAGESDESIPVTVEIPGSAEDGEYTWIRLTAFYQKDEDVVDSDESKIIYEPVEKEEDVWKEETEDTFEEERETEEPEEVFEEEREMEEPEETEEVMETEEPEGVFEEEMETEEMEELEETEETEEVFEEERETETEELEETEESFEEVMETEEPEETFEEEREMEESEDTEEAFEEETETEELEESEDTDEIFEEETETEATEEPEETEEVTQELTEEEVIERFSQVKGLGSQKAEILYENGYRSLDDLKEASEEELRNVKGIGPTLSEMIKESLEEME